MTFGPYSKAIVAITGAVLTWALATFPDNHTVSVWVSLVSAILTAAGVYKVRNEATK